MCSVHLTYRANVDVQRQKNITYLPNLRNIRKSTHALYHSATMPQLCGYTRWNSTGIIPFSRLGGFYANLGSAEIFLPPKKGVLSTNGK